MSTDLTPVQAEAIADRILGGGVVDDVSAAIQAALERDPHALTPPDALARYFQAVAEPAD